MPNPHEDIAKGRAKVADLDKKAATAATDAKVRIDKQKADIQADMSARVTEPPI